MKRQCSPPSSFRAMTLLEVMVVVLIVGLFVALAIPISGTFKKRAEKVQCISHMKALHGAFSGYVADNGSWPQLGLDSDAIDEDNFFTFWITSLEPYGVANDTWLCPSDKVYLQYKLAGEDTDDKTFGSYVPTPFEKGASIPFRWNQPWVLERGDYHGDGAHMLMPDGSVQDSQKPFYGR